MSAPVEFPTALPPPLYRHALQVVFGFLGIRDLHSVLSVSRGWQDAVCNGMPSIRGSAVVSERVSQVASSRLGVMHVSSLRCAGRLSPADLSELSLWMRSLDSLSFLPISPLRPGVGYSYPPKLRSIHLQLLSNGGSQLETLLAPLSQLATLRHLFLAFDTLPAALPGIAQCQQLTHLHLRSRAKTWVNKQIVASIRSLQQLDAAQIDLDAFDPAWVDSLFAEPRTMHWRKLIIGPISLEPAFHPIAPRLMAAASDPMWTIDQFHAIITSIPRFDFNYHAQAKNGTYSVEINALAAEQSLRIHRRDVMPHEKHIVELVSRFTNLTRIELVEIPGLKSLDFLLSPQTLRSLELRDLRTLSSFGLAAIRQCKSLRSLVIKGCFDSPISPGALEAFRVPSVEFPELRLFEFEPRVIRMHALSGVRR